MDYFLPNLMISNVANRKTLLTGMDEQGRIWLCDGRGEFYPSQGDTILPYDMSRYFLALKYCEQRKIEPNIILPPEGIIGLEQNLKVCEISYRLMDHIRMIHQSAKSDIQNCVKLLIQDHPDTQESFCQIDAFGLTLNKLLVEDDAAQDIFIRLQDNYSSEDQSGSFKQLSPAVAKLFSNKKLDTRSHPFLTLVHQMVEQYPKFNILDDILSKIYILSHMLELLDRDGAGFHFRGRIYTNTQDSFDYYLGEANNLLDQFCSIKITPKKTDQIEIQIEI